MVDGVKGRNDYEIACSKLKVKEVVSEKAKVRARKIVFLRKRWSCQQGFVIS